MYAFRDVLFDALGIIYLLERVLELASDKKQQSRFRQLRRASKRFDENPRYSKCFQAHVNRLGIPPDEGQLEYRTPSVPRSDDRVRILYHRSPYDLITSSWLETQLLHHGRRVTE